VSQIILTVDVLVKLLRSMMRWAGLGNDHGNAAKARDGDDIRVKPAARCGEPLPEVDVAPLNS